MMRGFDSIESMNSGDEILVKRKRGNKRFVISAFVIGGLFFLVGIFIGVFSHSSRTQPKDSNTTSPTIAPSLPVHHNQTPEEYIIHNVDVDSMRDKLKTWSSKTRLAGRSGAYEAAKNIHSLWTSQGLDDVHIDSYNVLLSLPDDVNPNKVIFYNKASGEVVFESSPFEPPLRTEENGTTIPSHNAFCAAGNVSGDIVYVNYGRMEDFQYLTDTLSIDLTKKIFIMRYGKIYSHEKVMNAATYKASGVIFYADPGDSNRNQPDDEKAYPESWWLPESGIRRESVQGDGGDIDTPGYPSKEYAFRHKVSDRKLPTMPCQPISYGDAIHILRNLNGPQSPTDWHGTLPIEYRIGPGWTNGTDIDSRLIINNVLDVRPINNVIGIIKGDIEPDRYVLLGNHHDAMTFGSVDAGSGMVALNQIVSIFSDFLKKGDRPRRTIVFCSWDASEQGHVGSFEWAEDHLKTLQNGVVAYLNVDMAVAGHYTLHTAASPLLMDSLYRAVKKVPSPVDGFKTLYDLWLAHPLTEEALSDPKVHFPFASDSDHKVFYQSAGLSTCSLSTTFNRKKLDLSQYPTYHTSYETFYLYNKFHDPGFKFIAALTQTWALLSLDLANSALIPFKMSRFSSAVNEFMQQISTIYKASFKKYQIDTEHLAAAVANFSQAITEFENQLSSETNWDKKPLKLRIYNDKMMQLERMFIDPLGLPDKPQIKNVIFGDTYFQGIHDAMHLNSKGEKPWDKLKEQISLLTFYFERASAYLGEVGL